MEALHSVLNGQTGLAGGYLLPAALRGPSAREVMPPAGLARAEAESRSTADQAAERAREAAGRRAFGALQSRQDELNALAKSVREGTESVAAPYVIHKLFPPYPPEQEARMALLDASGGMRRQIEKLMPQVLSDLAAQNAERIAEQLAAVISEAGGQQLAQRSAARTNGLTQNRPMLELIAQQDPVQ